MEPQPNAIASLKSLNGRMHGVQLQDLPYDPDIVPTPEQMDIISDYCLHSDLDATHNLWNALAEPMELRRALGAIHDKNFMSKSDSQIGEAIVHDQIDLDLWVPFQKRRQAGDDMKSPENSWHG